MKADNKGARALRVWRAEHRKNQTEVAAALGMHTADISRLESGGGVSLARAKAIKELCGISMDAWLQPVEGE
jgi:transcriptional regulator with XRE-family HTH domain